MKSTIDTAAYSFPVHSHEVWCGTSWKIGCKPCSGKVEILGKSTTWICPWNFGNIYPMFRADEPMSLVFNFDQNTTPVQPPPSGWSAGMFVISRTWLVTERAVILMPFIRSGFDTDVFHTILIRVKIKIFYQENKVLTDFVGWGRMMVKNSKT